MPDTPDTHNTPADGIQDFLAQLDQFSAANAAEAEQAAPAQEPEVVHEADNAEVHPAAQPAVPAVQAAPIDPSLLEVQRGQLELSARIAQLLENEKAQRTPTEEPAQLVPSFNFATDDLTAEERAAYGESEPIINKLAKRAVAEVLQQYTQDVIHPLAQENARLVEEMGRMSTMTAAHNENLADAQLRAMVASQIPDYQQFIKSATWQDFLNKEVPNSSGISYKTLAAMHGSNGNLEAIARMMLDASSASTTNNQPQAQRVTPGSAAAGRVVTRTAVPKALPYSGFEMAMEKYNRGQMTQEEWRKVSNAYDEALLKGLVDYNA